MRSYPSSPSSSSSMCSLSSRLFVIVSVFLSSGRRVDCLDLKLDIAGGRCHDNAEFDQTFDQGVMPGTLEVMDLTTTETIEEDAIREYGYSAFRGDDINNVDSRQHTEVPPDGQQQKEGDKGHVRRRRVQQQQHPQQGERDLVKFDCPVFKDCPGAGDATHWCAWICGFWQQPHTTHAASGGTSTKSDEGSISSEVSRSSPERRDNGFIRRVIEDLRIPDDDLALLDELVSSQTQQSRHSIRDTHQQHRQLWVGMEGLVCGWIERWLADAGLVQSNCLHGATLVKCKLDLGS